MKRLTLPLIAVAAALGSSAALAQESPAGSPADPNSTQNRQPGPSTGQPTDPAAGENPAARPPTAPPGTGSDYGGTGAGTGESGSAGTSSGTSGPMAQPPAPSNEPTGPGVRKEKPTTPPKGFQQQ